ncbi:MAG: UDP-N-acetylmuramoyl-L-alanyl-D-glutamate--2,6-diaminopimelate ligase [bacterium]
MKYQCLSKLLPDLQISNELMFQHISLDSRWLNEGDVFVAIQGDVAHGINFVPNTDAVELAAVLYDAAEVPAQQVEELSHVTGQYFIAVKKLKDNLYQLAQRCYGQPGEKLNITAVTGTNGKSSVVYLLTQAFDGLNVEARMMGTIGTGRWNQLHSSERTTADIFSVYRQLSAWADEGVQEVAMEVSSHALQQGRIADLKIKHAVFTNLSRDHLDYHLDMQKYGEAKAKLLDQPGIVSIHINLDDSWARSLKLTSRKQKQVSQSSQTDNADLSASDVEVSTSGCQFTLHCKDQSVVIKSALVGRFQVDNILSVASVLVEAGFSVAQIAKSCCDLKTVPGRMQAVPSKCIDFVVDYAHTPDGLKAALSSIEQIHCGPIVCIFGCGGDRDRGKRPMMAEVVEQYAQTIVVTNDNPRTELPAQIMADIKVGFKAPEKVHFIEDRRQAIHWSVQSASQHSLILLAGKGHEQGQEIGSKVLPFNDVEVAQEELGALKC